MKIKVKGKIEPEREIEPKRKTSLKSSPITPPLKPVTLAAQRNIHAISIGRNVTCK